MLKCNIEVSCHVINLFVGTLIMVRFGGGGHFVGWLAKPNLVPRQANVWFGQPLNKMDSAANSRRQLKSLVSVPLSPLWLNSFQRTYFVLTLNRLLCKTAIVTFQSQTSTIIGYKSKYQILVHSLMLFLAGDGKSYLQFIYQKVFSITINKSTIVLRLDRSYRAEVM